MVSRDYQAYFNTLPITAGVNSSLFWSGTFPVVDVVSNRPNPTGAVVYSSANEPSSAIINDLGYGVNWCGSKQGIVKIIKIKLKGSAKKLQIVLISLFTPQGVN